MDNYNVTNVYGELCVVGMEGMCQYDSFVDMDMDLTGSLDPDPGKPNCSTKQTRERLRNCMF
jgi:hypothetical protein